jgi:hypothetical protein
VGNFKYVVERISEDLGNFNWKWEESRYFN